MNPTTSPKRTLALPFLIAIGLALPARSGGPALYVSNEVDNTVAVISPQTNSVVATIVVGRRPRGLAASPDRRTVYVALGQDDALGVIDVATDSVLGQFPIGDGKTKPVRIAFSPDGRLAYLTEGAAASVSVVDVARQAVIDSIRVGRRPRGIALSADGKRLYTADGRSNTVSVIDTEVRKVIMAIPVGDRANDLVYLP